MTAGSAAQPEVLQASNIQDDRRVGNLTTGSQLVNLSYQYHQDSNSIRYTTGLTRTSHVTHPLPSYLTLADAGFSVRSGKTLTD
jgi:hypothetical protein